jgi:hypothetical protein
MPTRTRSTASIALLLTTGVAALAAAAVVPASTTVTTYPDQAVAPEPAAGHVVATTDPLALALAVSLLVVAVVAFAAAAVLTYGRISRKRRRRDLGPTIVS